MNPIADFDVCSKKNQWISPLKEKFNNLNNYINLFEWYICKLLVNYVLGKRILNNFEPCDFFRENTNIDLCIRVYVWFKGDKHAIWIWIWLILKNISLIDRIWSLWLVRFAHSPPSFIFWLGRLIFSVSINSHPDNIYIFGIFVLVTTFLFICFFFIIILEKSENQHFTNNDNRSLLYLDMGE